MAKIRVGQLARDLKLKIPEAIARLRKLGIEVKTGLNTVDEGVAEKLRAMQPAHAAPVAPDPAAASRIGGARRAAPPAATQPKVKRPSEKEAAPPAPPAAGGAATPLGRPAAGSAARPAATRAQATAARTGTAAAAAPPHTQQPGAPPRPAPARGAPAPTQRAAGATIPVRPTHPVPAPAPVRRPVLPAARPATAATRPGVPGSPVEQALRPQGAAPRSTAPAARPTVVGVRQGAVEPARTQPLRVAPGAPPGTGRMAPAPRPAAPAPGARPPQPVAARGAAHPSPRPVPAAPKPVAPVPPPLPEVFKEISITEGVTVKELSEKMDCKAKDIITRLLGKGIMATINQPLDAQGAVELCREFGFNAKVVSFEEEARLEHVVESGPADMKTRDPVVTIMGHVDHGKTSLLDTIRETNVVASEAGGITQHIGAYHIRRKERGITFIDTPGHEAFTLMRARGARVTDIVVLVVAADDGVMPQTIEAMDHARAAGVPLVVAINKVDKPSANLDRVKKQLSEHGLLVEDWGGQVVSVPVSARQKTGINELLEMILLVADIADLKADPKGHAAGTVLESRLDRSRGPVATMLVQRGTIRVGDPFIAGAIHGKVRAMFDDAGHRVREAGPAIPIEVLGLDGVPRAGDPFQVLEEEWRVRQIGAFRQQKLRQEAMAKSSRLTLDHLHQQISEGVVRELPLVVKADVHGSVEALTKTLQDLPSEKVKIKVIHAGSGAITETDVLLASASNAIVIGYNVRPERGAQELAEKEKVDIRLHSVIYDITDEIKNAMMGLLEPESKEVYLGRAEVRQTFKVPKIGMIAGCMVSDGRMLRGADVRLLRDNVVVIASKVSSLRRFKDDAGEVKSGYECGIGLANFNDIKTGDVIEAFRVEKIAVKSL